MSNAEPPPRGLYSSWPRGKPLTDRDPWWRAFTEIRTRPTVRRYQLGADRRERIVGAAASLMRECESPFNAEGPLTAGIRSGLCLAGWPWEEADDEARSIVHTSLARCGCAERPTWDQGQPEYTQAGVAPIEHTRCICCGRRIEDTAPLNSGWQRRFCSVTCSERERLRVVRISGRRRTLAEYWAKLASAGQAKREQRERNCDECGEPYIPAHASEPSRYCSKKCLGAVNGRRHARFRQCDECGTDYRVSAKGAHARFCSRNCREASEPPKLPRETQCPMCATIFRPTKPQQVFCSRRCGALGRFRASATRTLPDETAPVADEEPRQAA